MNDFPTIISLVAPFVLVAVVWLVLRRVSGASVAPSSATRVPAHEPASTRTAGSTGHDESTRRERQVA